MKQIVFCLAMVLMAAMAQARELSVVVDGKEIRMDYIVINHEIGEADRDRGNQESAMACSLLYYSHLAKGDLQGAARFNTDPAAAVDKWTKYRERVGAEFFTKIMNDYFTSRNVIQAEIVLAEDTMLVIKAEDGHMAQFFRKGDGKYLATDRPVAGKTLGRVLEMIQEGKIKL